MRIRGNVVLREMEGKANKGQESLQSRLFFWWLASGVSSPGQVLCLTKKKKKRKEREMSECVCMYVCVCVCLCAWQNGDE
jgi:hypothetical protein